MIIDHLPSVSDTVKQYGLWTKKSLGQHFLLDGNITDKIARAAGPLSTHPVLEVGPGPGGLTRSLLRAGATSLIAVEKDRHCLEALRPLVEAAEGRLTLRECDALTLSLADDALLHDCIIVSNLPYNISTALLTGWLHQLSSVHSMTLMFQKEVADRILATPSSSAYGRLSVLAQYCCELSRVFDIPPRAFTPPPKVMSTVVHFRPRHLDAMTVPLPMLEQVTASAFGQRRKMLRSSLKTLCPDPLTLCQSCDINPTLRAEHLSVEAFVALTKAYMAIANEITEGTAPK